MTFVHVTRESEDVRPVGLGNIRGLSYRSLSSRRRSLSPGRFNDCPRRRMSAHRSPTFATRSGMFRRVNVPGFTSPRSTSSHVQGADTGAPRFARTVYAAAKVAL